MIGGTQGKPIERRCPQEGADAMNASMKRARRLSEESFESLWVKSKPATIREARIYAGSIGEEMILIKYRETLSGFAHIVLVGPMLFCIETEEEKE